MLRSSSLPTLPTSEARVRARELCARAGTAAAWSRTLTTTTGVLITSARRNHARSLELTRARYVGGRVIRPSERRRNAAAEETRDSRTKTDELPLDEWAHASVFASRIVQGLVDDPDGESVNEANWTVREIDARNIPGALGPRCLVFESVEMVRRLWVYPAAWMSLPARALLRLA